MALGITYSQNPSRLIMENAKFMSDNIRQIGQQVQGAILEINTRKDLARMAQDMQGLNPQSSEFPVQAVQLASSHPLAIQDPRGQMALNILGKAHGDWQAGQRAALQSMRPMNVSGVGLVDPSTGEVITPAPTRPTSVPRGSRLVDPRTGEVIVEPEALPEKPFRLSPGQTQYDAAGNPVVTAPGRTGRSSGGMTDYQASNFKIRGVENRLRRITSEITPLEKQYRDLEKEEAELLGDKDNRKANEPRLNQIFTRKGEVGKRLEALGAERAKLDQEAERAYQEAASGPAEAPLPSEPGLGAIPQGDTGVEPELGVAPPLGAVPPAASNTEFVPVIDPDGRPGRIRASQLESALANGYRRR